jgi:hypothetical protein
MGCASFRPLKGAWVPQALHADCLSVDGQTISCRMSDGPAGDKINAAFQFSGWANGLDADAVAGDATLTNGDTGDTSSLSVANGGIKQVLRSTSTVLGGILNTLKNVLGRHRNRVRQNAYWEFRIEDAGEVGSVWVGAIQWPQFAAGWGARGFSYGGNLSDGASLLAQDFGHRLRTGDTVGLHVQRDDVLGIRIALWHNNRPFGDAFVIDGPLQPNGMLLPWVSFSTSGAGGRSAESDTTARVSVRVLPRNQVPRVQLADATAPRTLIGSWKVSGEAVLRGAGVQGTLSRMESEGESFEPEEEFEEGDLEGITVLLVIKPYVHDTATGIFLITCKVGNVLTTSVQKMGRPMHWQVSGDVASTRMMVGPQENAIENRMYAVLSGLVDLQLVSDAVSGKDVLRIEGPGTGEYITFERDVAVKQPVNRSDLTWKP